MSLTELFIIAVGLSMDAFAVAVCKGLAMRQMSWRGALIVGLYFGGFQAAMPLAGYLLGSGFSNSISSYDHWIAFILLAVIGGNMIKEGLAGSDECPDASLDVKNMTLLAIATSIDALAVGVSFAFCGWTLSQPCPLSELSPSFCPWSALRWGMSSEAGMNRGQRLQAA